MGQRNDGYENEADTLAERFVAQKTNSGKTGFNEGIGNAPKIQASKQASHRSFVPPSTEININASKGKGQSLPKSTQQEMEMFFESDLSEVQVHTGAEAVQMSEEIGAKAFTHEQDIYFGENAYDPSSVEGKKLIAHEVTHTLQQTGERVQKYDHTVSGGQSLVAIAERYGITEAQLRRANPSVPASGVIHPNQVLYIPIREHRVTGTDTLGGLAATYGVSVEDIQRANGLTNTVIQLNSVLAIPGFHAAAATRPAAPSPPTTPAPPTATPAPAATSSSLVSNNPAHILTDSQIRSLRYSQRLVRDLDAWTQRYINNYTGRLDRGGLATDLQNTLETRVRRLVNFRRTLQDTLTSNLSQGDDFLTLANIIYNEAGNFGPNAHAAVAYAWLNRNGGNVGANRGADLSGYVRLSVRWNGYTELGDQLTFIQDFPSSLQAANTVLNDTNRGANDPTQGATHWVSPEGLPDYNPQNASHVRNRYSRTYGSHRNKAFPNYAIDNDDTARLRAARTGPNAIITSDYQEITIPGVPGEEFLFYRGVL